MCVCACLRFANTCSIISSYPYDLILRGKLYYWLAFMQFEVPVCSVSRVRNATDVVSTSCILSE